MAYLVTDQYAMPFAGTVFHQILNINIIVWPLDNTNSYTRGKEITKLNMRCIKVYNVHISSKYREITEMAEETKTEYESV